MEVLKSKMVLYLKKRKRSKAENHVVNKRIKLDDVEQYIDLFQFANVEYIITNKTTYEDQDKFHITVDIHSTRNLWNHKEYSIRHRLKTRNQLQTLMEATGPIELNTSKGIASVTLCSKSPTYKEAGVPTPTAEFEVFC